MQKNADTLMEGNALTVEVKLLTKTVENVMSYKDKATLQRILAFTSKSNSLDLWEHAEKYVRPYLREKEVIDVFVKIIDSCLYSKELGIALGKRYCEIQRVRDSAGFVVFDGTIYYILDNVSSFVNDVLNTRKGNRKSLLFPRLHEHLKFKLDDDYIEELEDLLSENETFWRESIGNAIYSNFSW